MIQTKKRKRDNRQAGGNYVSLPAGCSLYAKVKVVLYCSFSETWCLPEVSSQDQTWGLCFNEGTVQQRIHIGTAQRNICLKSFQADSSLRATTGLKYWPCYLSEHDEIPLPVDLLLFASGVYLFCRRLHL